MKMSRPLYAQTPAPVGIDPETHRLVLAAIQQKRLLSFYLDGKARITEPHDYGIQNGRVRLLAYQVAGSSSGPLPGWRWIEIPRISQPELLVHTFPGNRVAPTGKHHKWEVLFARVEPPETDVS